MFPLRKRNHFLRQSQSRRRSGLHIQPKAGHMISRVVVVLTIASLLAGCSVGPKYHRPGVNAPPVYRADPSNPPGPQSLADEKWFELFKDKELQDLIHAALAGHFYLRDTVA